MLDGQIDLDIEKWPTTNDIISLVSIILTSLNTILGIYLFYKFKIIAAAIAMYQPVQTSATTLPNFKFIPPTTSFSPSWTNVLNSNIKWDHGIFAFVFISLLLIIVILIQSSKSNNMHTKLCLEIITGYRCVSIPILSLPLCPFY